jgi:endonuclease/exonuclease/phosphatase family metal-dependent hydrolase
MFISRALAAEAPITFSVASYNVENYLLSKVGTRSAKSPEARAQVCNNILEMKPDVLALQEMGDTNALLELRNALKLGGLDYPVWEHLSGPDPDIHLAVLSRFPLSDRQLHARESYLLEGRRFQVGRGFLQVSVRVTTNYTFTLLVAHLKSKRGSATADEADMRLEEAKLLRGKVDAILKANPEANLIVVGDFNDIPTSAPVRTLVGRARGKLVDLRPVERNGDSSIPPRPGAASRSISWTYFYAEEDLFSRFDYLLVSPGMHRESRMAENFVLTVPNWGLASDHRPILAVFTGADM